MRLVIERDGGFVVVETDDVTAVDVRNDGVEVSTRDGKALTCEREGHAASVALATAIAVKCGELVEALAESEDDKRERALLEGLGELAPRLLSQRAEGERPKSLGEWVAGEPPKGGLWYVVVRAGAFGCVAWDGLRFRDWYSETVLMGGEVAHLPTPVPSRR